MNINNISASAISLSILFLSCGEKLSKSDATGTFEATVTIVSAEGSGQILALNIHEGDSLTKGQLIGYLDSMSLHLSKMQLIQNKKTILSGRPDIRAQSESLQAQIENAKSDRDRIENLVKGGVATKRQLDDANSKIDVLQSQLLALKSNLSTTTTNLNEQGNSVVIQLAQIEDQLRKCSIINPTKGTVLVKYANAYEMASVGRPLYEIADLSEINLRAYITADQFSRVKIGSGAKVTVDAEGGKSKAYDGIVEWISDKAEFTPKTIQTRDERANRVYAIKIRVHNDGTLKIGMYGEVIFI